jgi:hypothetical protein
MAEEAAEALLAALKEHGSADFTAAAAKNAVTPQTSDYITRSAAQSSTLPAQIVNMGFELSEGTPYPEEVVAANGMFYVFRVMEKRSPSPDLFSRKENDFRTGLLERKKSAILKSWLANMRDKAEIEINQQFL